MEFRQAPAGQFMAEVWTHFGFVGEAGQSTDLVFSGPILAQNVSRFCIGSGGKYLDTDRIVRQP